MYVNRYSVRVVGGKEDHSGYILMRDGQKYSLSLKNDWYDPCDAEIKLNGVSVGTFRIPAYGSVNIERGANDDGRFTFFASGSAGGQAAGSGCITKDLRGLIQVVFTPGTVKEYVRPVKPVQPCGYRPCGYRWIEGNKPWSSYSNVYRSTDEGCTWVENTCNSVSYNVSCSNYRSAPTANMGEGVTGLSGHSNQHFYSAEELDYDYARQTTISLRLVEDKNGNNVVDARPVVSAGNVVPPAID